MAARLVYLTSKIFPIRYMYTVRIHGGTFKAYINYEGIHTYMEAKSNFQTIPTVNRTHMLNVTGET